jgi:hypothetical protein
MGKKCLAILFELTCLRQESGRDAILPAPRSVILKIKSDAVQVYIPTSIRSRAKQSATCDRTSVMCALWLFLSGPMGWSGPIPKTLALTYNNRER